MTRQVSTTFVGAEQREVDVDAPVYASTLEGAIGDTALVEDLLRGTNSPPADSEVDHSGLDAGSGRYRGCPLAIMPAQQLMGVSATHRRHLRDGGATPGAWAYLVPVFLPLGEDRLHVRNHECNPHYEHRFLAMDTSYDVLADQLARPPVGAPTSRDKSAVLLGLNPGEINLIGMRTDYSPSGEARVFHGPRIYFNRIASPNYHPLVKTRVGDNPYGLLTQASGGGVVMNPPDLDSSMFDVPYPVHGYLTDRTARFQNTLDEYLTGAPANGNKDYTLEADADTAPSVSAFHDHAAGSDKPDEPTVMVPFWIESFGGVQEDGMFIATTAGDDTWAARGRKTTASWTTFLENVWVYLPDLPNTLGNTRLRLAILAVDNNAGWAGATTEVDARVTMYNAAGTPKTTSVETFTPLGASGNAARYAVANVQAIEFYRDEANRIKLEFDFTALHKVDGSSFLPLGVCLYWGP